MAASLIIEQESGVVTSLHPHNGYYAGDFSGQPVRPLSVGQVHALIVN
jgi:hypothetical protein